MKVNIEIDCTPEEARRFMGLPDVEKANAVYVDAFAKAMQTAGSVSPVKWMIRSFEGAIWRDLPWSEMLSASGILLAMGAVFYLIGLAILLKYDA